MKKTELATFIISLIMTIIGYYAYSARNEYFSVIPMIFLAVPAYYALIKTNFSKGLVLIFFLSIYATLIEALSITTSFPYGYFEYNSQLGYKLFDLVPWNVSFGWVPLVIGSYAISCWIFKKHIYQFLFGVSFLVATDLIIDPGAVLMGFWTWTSPGLYYSIPLSNYFGWIFSSIIAGILFFWIIPKNVIIKLPYYSAYTLVLGNSFWIGVTFNAGYLIPFFLGVILQIFILFFINKQTRV